MTLALHDVPLSTSIQSDHVEGPKGVSEWERDEIWPRPLQTPSFVGATLAVVNLGSMPVTCWAFEETGIIGDFK